MSREKEKRNDTLWLYLLPASVLMALSYFLTYPEEAPVNFRNVSKKISKSKQLRLSELLELQARTGHILVADLTRVDVKGRALVTIKKEHISLFKTIQETMPYEIGGYIDFDHVNRGKEKKGLKRVIYYYGDDGSVDFPSLDFEIEFHTHPTDKKQFHSPPSGADIVAVLENAIMRGTQVAMVFAKEGIYVYGPRETLLQDYIDSDQKERDKMLDSMVKYTDKAYDLAEHHKDTKIFEDAMDVIDFDYDFFLYGRDVQFNINIIDG